MTGSPCGADYLRSNSAQQSEHNRPRRPVLLQVDQQLAEGPRLRVPPELADPVGAVEVGHPEDVEEFGASSRRMASRRPRSSVSISSKVTGRTVERLDRKASNLRLVIYDQSHAACLLEGSVLKISTTLETPRTPH